MNWVLNDSSANFETPFPAIWALNYELQFDFKKGKTLKIMPYF